MNALQYFKLTTIAPALFTAMAYAASPVELQAGYEAQAGPGAKGNADRGQLFFTTKHDKDWACASCHTASPTVDGKHATTGKVIGPLAPAFNPARFTDATKTEKWFRRNCNDVAGRECTAGKKADVLAWLQTLNR